MTKSKFKPFVLLWLSTFAIGALAYVSLYANSLTNNSDGLLYPSLCYASKWEISIGRWLWPFLDGVRQGYAADPFNSLLTLALIAGGTIMLFDCFHFVGKRRAYLYAALMPVSVTVCAHLSYRYMSPTFGLGFFLSILAVWFLAKEKSKKFFSVTKLLSVVALTLTLGLYQAFLGVFCVILLFCFLCRVCSCEKSSQSWRFLLGGSVCCAGACCVYKLMWDTALFFTGVSSSNYMGANSVSFGSILLSLPQRLVDTYRVFFDYFFNDTIRHNLLQEELLYFVLLGLLFSLPLFCTISFFAKKKHAAGLSMLVFVLLPPAACVALLLAPDAGLSVQMTSSLSLIVPLLLIFADVFLTRQKAETVKVKQILRFFAPAVAAVVLFGNTYMVGIDLEVMSAGRTSTDTLITSVYQALIQDDPALEGKYLFVGSPSDNPLFSKSPLWERSNNYSRFGLYHCERSDITRRAYNGFFRNIGVNLVISQESDEFYDSILHSDKIKQMPVYPADGSIQKIDEYTVVKISDVLY